MCSCRIVDSAPILRDSVIRLRVELTPVPNWHKSAKSLWLKLDYSTKLTQIGLKFVTQIGL